MPQAARITDAVAGTTAGEHTGHVPPHSPEPFSGEISGACSGTVRINGLSAATVGYRGPIMVLWASIVIQILSSYPIGLKRP